MAVGRKKCVIKKKMVQYDELMERIKKSFYYGNDDLKYDNFELTSPLAEYTSELFSEPQKGNSLKRLTKISAGSVRVPNPCSLIMALIYLDRLNEVNPSYVRNGISPSDLFLVSMIVSSKFCYDDVDVGTFYLSDFLEDCDMSSERYKKLELEFLCAIDWNIYISNEIFSTKLETIEKILARREGIRRGWLTYTELLNFLPSFTLAKFLLNNITVMAVSYVASVMTMAGAFFLVSNIPGNGLLKTPNQPDISTNITEQNENIIDSSSTIRGQIDNHNDNRNNTGLNVEKELQKLEDQYNQEHLLEMAKRNNENSGPLINFYENYLNPDKITLTFGFNNWVKDGTDNNNGVTDDNNFNFQNNYYKANIFNVENFQNLTKTIFWDFISDAEKSLRIPFIWFKFI